MLLPGDCFERRSNLLIIGAGVAGVTAAWQAANLGVNVTLTDENPRPFSAQESCASRWLHPNEYRWPESGFGNQYFPFEDKADVPDILHWRAGLPSEIVERWRSRFDGWINAQVEPSKGSVTWRDDLPLPYDGMPLLRYFESVGFGDIFDIVLLCLGGREQCFVKKSQHRGFRFWETDDYGKIDYGASAKPERRLRTLISGGGDGALQDFLRIACQGKEHARPVHALWIFTRLALPLEASQPFRQVAPKARLSE